MTGDGSPPIVSQLSASDPREQVPGDIDGDIMSREGSDDWIAIGTNVVGAARSERPAASEQLASDPKPGSPPQANKAGQAATSAAAATAATAAAAKAVAAATAAKAAIAAAASQVYLSSIRRSGTLVSLFGLSICCVSFFRYLLTVRGTEPRQ